MVVQPKFRGLHALSTVERCMATVRSQENGAVANKRFQNKRWIFEEYIKNKTVVMHCESHNISDSSVENDQYTIILHFVLNVSFIQIIGKPLHSDMVQIPYVAISPVSSTIWPSLLLVTMTKSIFLNRTSSIWLRMTCLQMHRCLPNLNTVYAAQYFFE